MAIFEISLKPFTDWLHLHQHWAGLITFLIAFSESLAIIGSIIPGSVTMTAIGILAGSGVIPLFNTIIYGICGAVMGDGVSFWIGLHFRDELKYIWPFSRYPIITAKGQEFFGKHGSKSIILGRFVGPMRSMIPVIAGMMQMPPLKFICANLVASSCWATLYILPGVFIGAATEELSPKAATFITAIAFVILISLWLISGCIKLIAIWLFRVLNNNVDRSWSWMRQHPRLQKFAEFISDPRYPTSYSQLGLCMLLGFFLLLLLIISSVITHCPLISNINNAAFHIMQSYRITLLDKIFVVLTFCGDSKVLLVPWAAVTIWLYWKQQWWTTAHWLLNGIIAALALIIIKHGINFPRPTGLNITSASGSFPSAHVTFAIVILGFLGYLTAASLTFIARRLIYAPIIAIIFLIACSRMYLGAHWLFDILGGLLLGIIILCATIVSYRRKIVTRPACNTLLAMFLSIYCCSVIAYYKLNFTQQLYAYTPQYVITTIKYAKWWSHDSDITLPLYRTNRLGEATALLNLQWAASLSSIKDTLLQHGWHEPEKNSVIKLLGRIATTSNYGHHMPVMQQLYNNKPPVLTMIKDMGNNSPSIMLSLWQSYYRFSDNTVPLWFGTVNYIIIWHPWRAHHQRLMPLLQLPVVSLGSALDKFKIQQLHINANIMIKNMPNLYLPVILLIANTD